MTLTIPFSVEGSPKECLIELRDLSGHTLRQIFRGICQPGVHSVKLDPGALDAGVYALHLVIGEESHTYPVQYMP